MPAQLRRCGDRRDEGLEDAVGSKEGDVVAVEGEDGAGGGGRPLRARDVAEQEGREGRPDAEDEDTEEGVEVEDRG